MELKLHSLGGYEPITFQWPLKTKEQGFEIIEAISYACQEESPLKECANSIFDAYDLDSYESMLSVCEKFNKAVDQMRLLVKSGEYDWQARASVPLLHHVLRTCYDQSVSEPENLNHYEPFSAEVYGETSYELVDKMINTMKLTKEDRFIDLGSGVGHVVLQVAAATSCSYCYGVEKAHWPALYAKNMSSEFEKWMRFYGKEHGAYELFKGNFLLEDFKEIISSATVIFVNNFAFGPQVDHELKIRFANLKEGTRIVSSKAFCPINMHISERNLGDIGAILRVEELAPLRGYVSWTPKQVTYYLHTVDRTQLEDYFRKRGAVDGDQSLRKNKHALKTMSQQQLKDKSNYWKERRRRIADASSPKINRNKAFSDTLDDENIENLNSTVKGKILEIQAFSADKKINNNIDRHKQFNSYFKHSNDLLKNLPPNISSTKLTECNIVLNKIDDKPAEKCIEKIKGKLNAKIAAKSIKNQPKSNNISKLFKNQLQVAPKDNDNVFNEEVSVYISPERFQETQTQSKPFCNYSEMSSDEEDEYDNVDDLENALELFHNETIKIVHDEDYKSKDVFNDADLVHISGMVPYLETEVTLEALLKFKNNSHLKKSKNKQHGNENEKVQQKTNKFNMNDKKTITSKMQSVGGIIGNVDSNFTDSKVVETVKPFVCDTSTDIHRVCKPSFNAPLKSLFDNDNIINNHINKNNLFTSTSDNSLFKISNSVDTFSSNFNSRVNCNSNSGTSINDKLDGLTYNESSLGNVVNTRFNIFNASESLSDVSDKVNLTFFDKFSMGFNDGKHNSNNYSENSCVSSNQLVTPLSKKYAISLPKFSPITPETPINDEQKKLKEELLHQEMQQKHLQQKSLYSSTMSQNTAFKPKARKSIDFSEVINSDARDDGQRNDNPQKTDEFTQEANRSVFYENNLQNNPIKETTLCCVASPFKHQSPFTSPTNKISTPYTQLNTPKNTLLPKNNTPIQNGMHSEAKFSSPLAYNSFPNPLSIPISFPRQLINESGSTIDTTTNLNNFSMRQLDESGLSETNTSVQSIEKEDVKNRGVKNYNEIIATKSLKPNENSLIKNFEELSEKCNTDGSSAMHSSDSDPPELEALIDVIKKQYKVVISSMAGPQKQSYLQEALQVEQTRLRVIEEKKNNNETDFMNVLKTGNYSKIKHELELRHQICAVKNKEKIIENMLNNIHSSTPPPKLLNCSLHEEDFENSRHSPDPDMPTLLPETYHPSSSLSSHSSLLTSSINSNTHNPSSKSLPTSTEVPPSNENNSSIVKHKSKNKKKSKSKSKKAPCEENAKALPKLTLCFSKVHQSDSSIKDGVSKESSNGDIFPRYQLSSGKKKNRKHSHKKSKKVDAYKKHDSSDVIGNCYEIVNKSVIEERIENESLLSNDNNLGNEEKRLPKMHFSRKLLNHSNVTSENSILTSLPSTSSASFLPLLVLTEPTLNTSPSKNKTLSSKPSMCFSPISSCESISPIITKQRIDDEEDAISFDRSHHTSSYSSMKHNSSDSQLCKTSDLYSRLSHSSSLKTTSSTFPNDDKDQTLRQEDLNHRPEDQLSSGKKRKSSGNLDNTGLKRSFSTYKSKNSKCYETSSNINHHIPDPFNEEVNTPASLVYLSLKTQSQPSSVSSQRSDSRDSGYDKDSEIDCNEKLNLLNGCANVAELSRINECCEDGAYKDRSHNESSLVYNYGNDSDKQSDYLYKSRTFFKDRTLYEKDYSKILGKQLDSFDNLHSESHHLFQNNLNFYKNSFFNHQKPFHNTLLSKYSYPHQCVPQIAQADHHNKLFLNQKPDQSFCHFAHSNPHISNGLSFESLASHYEQRSKLIPHSNNINHNH